MLKRYLITGLLLWVPLGITVWVLHFLITTLDQSMLLVPLKYRPEALLGFPIPGLGVLLTLLILLVTGAVARNFLGARLVRIWEGMLTRIPVVKSIYSSVKQIGETLLSDSSHAFRKALLVEFPCPGTWTVAFLTGAPSEARGGLPAGHLSVYVPTTPNPTSGYLLLVAKDRVRELDMSVDEALKYVISMGVAVPGAAREAGAPRAGSPAPG